MSGRSILSRYHPGKYTDEQFSIDKRIFKYAVFASFALVSLIWLIKLFELEYGYDFSDWGVVPLTFKGLKGVVISPLIHKDINHLIANSFPLIILSFSLFFFYRKYAYPIFVLIYLFTGLLVWFGGREATHIGASGVIYGLAAFLFVSGVISYNTRLLTISLIVTLLYGSMIWGILPLKAEVSWESHLWGGISGAVLAFLFRNSAPGNQTEEVNAEEEDNNGPEYWNVEDEDKTTTD